MDTKRPLGVRAAPPNSTRAPSASRAVEQALLARQLDLLYVAPEGPPPRTLEHLHQAQVALFAIDEAHHVSQWGHNVRQYQQFSVLERELPEVLCMDLTADDWTRADIRRVLGLQHAPEFLSSVDQPNIQCRVAPKEQLLDFIQTEHPGDAGVAYCLSRKSVQDTAK